MLYTCTGRRLIGRTWREVTGRGARLHKELEGMGGVPRHGYSGNPKVPERRLSENCCDGDARFTRCLVCLRHEASEERHAPSSGIASIRELSRQPGTDSGSESAIHFQARPQVDSARSYRRHGIFMSLKHWRNCFPESGHRHRAQVRDLLFNPDSKGATK
jgi:hypothetical protein